MGGKITINLKEMH